MSWDFVDVRGVQIDEVRARNASERASYTLYNLLQALPFVFAVFEVDLSMLNRNK